MDVGIETKEPTANPFSHATTKPEEKPIFTTVIVKDITNDIAKPIKNPETRCLYFCETVTIHSSPCNRVSYIIF